MVWVAGSRGSPRWYVDMGARVFGRAERDGAGGLPRGYFDIGSPFLLRFVAFRKRQKLRKGSAGQDIFYGKIRRGLKLVGNERVDQSQQPRHKHRYRRAQAVHAARVD